MSYSATILADNPKAYYRMNATSGTVERDASGNGYDAMLTGVAAYSQPGALAGDSDTSLLFTAIGGLTVPYTLNYTTFSAFSSEFWSDASGAWQYIAITCDGTTTIVYVSDIVDTPGSSGLIEISSIFDFAGSDVASRIDEWAIYDYVLSPAQTAAHEAAGYLPHALFPATTRRTGVLMSPARRTSIFPAMVRRAGVVAATTRRLATLPSTTRRTGVVPAAARRTGVIPAPIRRTGVVAVTERRNGTFPAPQRRQS